MVFVQMFDRVVNVMCLYKGERKMCMISDNVDDT